LGKRQQVSETGMRHPATPCPPRGLPPGYALVDLGGSYEVAARLPSGGTALLVY